MMNAYTIVGTAVIGGPQSLIDGVIIADLGLDGSIEPNSPEAGIVVSSKVCLGNVSIYEGEPLFEFLGQLIEKARDTHNEILHHCHSTGRVEK